MKNWMIWAIFAWFIVFTSVFTLPLWSVNKTLHDIDDSLYHTNQYLKEIEDTTQDIQSATQEIELKLSDMTCYLRDETGPSGG